MSTQTKDFCDKCGREIKMSTHLFIIHISHPKDKTDFNWRQNGIDLCKECAIPFLELEKVIKSKLT